MTLLADIVCGPLGAAFVEIADADEIHALDAGELAGMAGAAGSDADDGHFDLVEFRCGEVAHVFRSGFAGWRGSLRADHRGQGGKASGDAAKGFDEITAGCRILWSRIHSGNKKFGTDYGGSLSATFRICHE